MSVVETPLVVEGFGVDADILLAGGFLFPILSNPGFEAFAGGGVFASEGQGGDVGVGNADFVRTTLGDHADVTTSQRGRFAAPVEDVAFQFFPVLQRDAEIPAVVEGLLKSRANFGLGGDSGDPAFQVLVSEAEFVVGL